MDCYKKPSFTKLQKIKKLHDHLLMLRKSKFNSIKTLISQALIDIFFVKNIVQQ